MTSIMTLMMTSVSDQPKLSISPWLIGAKRNMPAEPAAVPRPNTKLRRSAGTWRAKAASTMPKPPAATPSPTSTPPPIDSISGLSAIAIR